MLSATRTIEAPREAVFAFLDEPPNQVRVAPSVVGVADVRPKAGGGKRLLYGYRAFGVVFTGSLETSVYEPPERIVFQMDGDVRGTITWELEAVDETTTRFTYATEYDLSAFPGASLFRPVFAWYNRRELETTVANVERFVERGDRTRSDFQRESVTAFEPSETVELTDADDGASSDEPATAE